MQHHYLAFLFQCWQPLRGIFQSEILQGRTPSRKDLPHHCLALFLLESFLPAQQVPVWQARLRQAFLPSAAGFCLQVFLLVHPPHRQEQLLNISFFLVSYLFSASNLFMKSINFSTPATGIALYMSLIHISEPTRLGMISYA